MFVLCLFPQGRETLREFRGYAIEGTGVQWPREALERINTSHKLVGSENRRVGMLLQRRNTLETTRPQRKKKIPIVHGHLGCGLCSQRECPGLVDMEAAEWIPCSQECHANNRKLTRPEIVLKTETTLSYMSLHLTFMDWGLYWGNFQNTCNYRFKMSSSAYVAFLDLVEELHTWDLMAWFQIPTPLMMRWTGHLPILCFSLLIE